MKKLITAVMLFILIMAETVSAQAAANVAALMYHKVSPDPERWGDYTISAEQLDNDIQYFLDCGYITMTATELAAANMSDIDGRKILLLTFDDGYSNFYTQVYPILQKHNVKATMFLVGAYVNRYGYLTEDEIYEMAHSGFVEIGNHTNAIHQMPLENLYNIYTNAAGVFDVLTDIKNNGDKLKAITGIDVTSISWPYGYYTDEVDQKVKSQLGYKISFSTDYGINKFTGCGDAPLKRMNREYSASTQWVFDRANGKF